MTEMEAETTFAHIHWPSTKGQAACPYCSCPTCYEARRPSGALFAFHKMPLRIYLAAIVIFCNEVKGKSALAPSRDLDVQCKTAFVLAHKMREAMASELKGMQMGGPGRFHGAAPSRTSERAGAGAFCDAPRATLRMAAGSLAAWEERQATCWSGRISASAAW